MLPLVNSLAVGALGLITGSFLNAVIHRLPRGISLLNPRRSFCPGCGKTIPWHENLPVASWVLLCGRCSGCLMPIAFRYPLVEVLTAGCYLLLWGRFGLPLAPVFWLFLSMLIAASFIDFDHLIIPDEITLGGTAAGVLCSSFLPSLVGASVWWQGFLQSLLGAAAGFSLLWCVVELGKVTFGRKRIKPQLPSTVLALELAGTESEPMVKIHGISPGGDGVARLSEEENSERIPLAELFYRKSDRIEAECEWIEIDGERHGPGRLIIAERTVSLGAHQWVLADAVPVRADCTELTLPREAMGFGDVKFLACIGAFLGWKGVLFSLFAGSVVGASIGIVTIATTRGRSGGRIPFGPYLAIGAALWVFAGQELLDLYIGWTRGEAALFLLLPRH